MADVPHDDAAVAARRLNWCAFPYVLVRVPGVARSQLRGYRHEDALALDGRARVLSEHVRRESERLRAALFRLVPRLPPGPRRHALAAQRALFNVARLPQGDWLKAVEAESPPLAKELAIWSSLHADCLAIVDARDRRFDADRDAGDAALLRLCRQPTFELGLALANPALARTLSEIPSSGARTRRQLKAMRRAMRYLLRAALTPTPRGFFCSTAAAPFDREPSSGPAHAREERGSQLQVNRELLGRVFAALAARPSVRRRATVRLAAQAFADGEGVWTFDRTSQYRTADGDAYRRLSSLPSDGTSWAESGFSDAELTAWLDAGLVELDWNVSEEHADDLDVLLRLVWESGFADLELLGLLPMLTRLRACVARAADRSARRETLSELAHCAATLPGGDPPSAIPLIFEDTWCDAPAVPPLTAFLDELAHFSTGLVWPQLMPEEESLLGLFKRFYPKAPQVPVLRFHRQYLALCRELGLGADHWTNSPHLCRWLGIRPLDPVSRMHARLAQVVANHAGGELSYPWKPSELGDWEQAGPLRLSARIAPAPRGRFHPVFWGGQSMSLLPRYARLPFPGVDLAEASRAWFARWPAIADIHGSLGRNVDIRPRVTRHSVEAPGARPNRDALRLRDLMVRPDSESGRLMVIDRTGAHVTPLFLGVSVPARLTPIHEFLFHLSDRRTSFFECALRSVGQLILERVRRPPSVTTRLPLISLGDRIVLCGSSFVVPGQGLPQVGATIDRAGFFRFHDWLATNNLPMLAQTWTDGRAPTWVDLAHPLGVRDLLNLVRDAPAFLLRPPLLADGEASVRRSEGEFDVEYYVELAAGGTSDLRSTDAR